MVPKAKCVNCGAEMTHEIIDWRQHYPWCPPCWLEYLADYREAQNREKRD